jgi:hypothetical protein
LATAVYQRLIGNAVIAGTTDRRRFTWKFSGCPRRAPAVEFPGDRGRPDSPYGPAMSFRTDLQLALASLQGLAGSTPTSITLHDPSGLKLRIDFTTVDSLSCAFQELALDVPRLNAAAFPVIQQWAQQLSRRINYLLENIGPLEFDPQAGEVLIRSTPPDQLPDGTQYYEITLAQQGGSFLLRRFKSVKGVAGRTPVEIAVTHEVLFKLVDDLVATIPP